MIKAAITSIEKMTEKMFSKYRLNEKMEKGEIEKVQEQEKEEEEYVNVDESLRDIAENMRYRNEGR
jgi:hypothetical protein